jgi:hypothetical protein
MDIRLDGYYLINGVWTLNTSIPLLTNKVYGVLDQPVSPMSPAWVSLLEYSCRWGRGKNTFDDAAQAITFGVFFQRPGFAYPSDTDSHWVDVYDPDGPTFKLKALLDEWDAGNWTDGNCVDVSCLTMIALCSVGMDFSARQLTGSVLSPPHPYAGNFYTNPVCLIGSDPTIDSTYSPSYWGFHQICVPTGDASPPSNDARIWDPTGAQKEDLNGNGYRNPPAYHPDHLWPQKDYWQKWFMPESRWLGLVNEPTQGTNDPQLHGLGTWKCQVDTGAWPLP